MGGWVGAWPGISQSEPHSCFTTGQEETTLLDPQLISSFHGIVKQKLFLLDKSFQTETMARGVYIGREENEGPAHWMVTLFSILTLEI